MKNRDNYPGKTGISLWKFRPIDFDYFFLYNFPNPLHRAFFSCPVGVTPREGESSIRKENPNAEDENEKVRG